MSFEFEAPMFRQAFTVLRHRTLRWSRNRSRHGFTYIFGNRNPDGLLGPLPDEGCCAPVSGGFGNILVSSDAKQTWYNGVYVTLEKAYSEASPWGMTLAYTYSEAEETGGDLFSLDYPLVSDYPRHPTSGDERHRRAFSISASTFGHAMRACGWP